MKPLMILILGCCPLAVITVWSFVELGQVNDRLGGSGMPRDPGVETAEVGAVAGRAARERPLVEVLVEADLFAGEPIPELEKASGSSCLLSLREDWSRWVAAHQMAVRCLRVQRLLTTPLPEPFTEADVERLEASLRASEALKQKLAGSPAQGAGELVALLDRRALDWQTTIARNRLRLEGDALLVRAREAFQTQTYDECVSLLDELLGQEYSGVFDPDVTAKMGLLRQRAIFSSDARLLFAELGDSHPLADRQRLLEGFVDKHGETTSPTSLELRILDHCRKQLHTVKGQLAEKHATRAAEAAIRALSENPPPELEARLDRAAEIAAAAGNGPVLTSLRRLAKGWLEERLPDKKLREPPDLLEAETRKGQIVRGFFMEVTDSSGEVFGYKRYPTRQAVVDPSFDVGTYRKDEFVAAPGVSVPGSTVLAYQEAKRRLFEKPSRGESWVAMAQTCQNLATRLHDYHAKQGASEEDADLSFENERRFLEAFLGGSGMADLETLFGP